MSRRQFTAASVLIVTALALAGCAGASSSTGDATGAATEDYGLVESGTLTVATEGTYRPFSFHEDGGGELTGYDVEIARAVADELGLKVEFKETQWDAIFAGLDAQRFDVIANQVTINDERKAKYALSAPYTVSHGVIVVKGDNSDITSFASLKGKTTAQSLSSNWHDLAVESGAKVEAVEGWAQAVALLQQGRVDATINDELTFLDYKKIDGAKDLKIAAETDDAGEAAFAARKDEDKLMAAIDGALEKLRADGTLAKLGEKYFGQDVSE
ncbi:amino acid ABC transporter substrate-binding protein [Microbacterium gorillae]|uniref:amino acid ABC transporter substrate-binding protein n=1 Tax=Microbacterium gorillae TaxID=1231063 RepID=UPI00058B8359|nr:amino acid ABC transporter substrate-binding protein [Microbacterium gorillae]